jgi:hypothetical protein
LEELKHQQALTKSYSNQNHIKLSINHVEKASIGVDFLRKNSQPNQISTHGGVKRLQLPATSSSNYR